MAKVKDITRGGGGEPRTHCIRCGTCCQKGGPTLHKEDTSLLDHGILQKGHLYTLRRGEILRNIDDALMVLDEEMVKIKGQSGTWACIFYDSDLRSCTIYDYRPIECTALKCWDLKEIREAMARPRLQRRDIIAPDDGILKVIAVHEERCAYQTLESEVKALEGPDSEGAVNRILDILRYDYSLRSLVRERLNVAADAMDFFFGRSLTETIGMFGLCVRQEGDQFVLMPREACSLP